MADTAAAAVERIARRAAVFSSKGGNIFWENKLDSWVNQVRLQAALPLRLELWNGRRFDFPQDPQVTVRIPKAASLPYLLTPSLANLGTAYVEGKLDIEGRADEIIDVGSMLARQMLTPIGKFDRLRRNVRHSRKVDGEAIRFQVVCAKSGRPASALPWSRRYMCT